MALPESTKQMLMAHRMRQPDVGSIEPLTPMQVYELEKSKLSSDPVIANLQKLGRGVKGLLEPVAPLDYFTMVMPAAKVAKPVLEKVSKPIVDEVAARLENAKKMGFDVDNPIYHGSNADIKSFRLPTRETGQTRTAGTGIFFSSSPRIASSYVKNAVEVAEGGVEGAGPSIYPVYAKTKEYLKIIPSEKGMNWSQLEVNKLNIEFPNGDVKKVSEVFNLDPDSMITTDELSRLARGINDKGLIIKDIKDIGIGITNRFDDATKYLNKLGYNPILPQRGPEAAKINAKIPEEIMDEAFKYAQKMMEKPSDITVAFDPTTVRSVFAKFDPKKSQSDNLLASIGGASLLSLTNEKDKPKETNKGLL